MVCLNQGRQLVPVLTPRPPGGHGGAMDPNMCLRPHGDLQPPLASPGEAPRPAGRSGPGFYQITAFAFGLSASEI